MQLAFKIMEPGEPVRDFVVEAGQSIGRHDENDLVLNDSKVSGRHARIVESDGQLHIEDLGSSNGVEVLSGPCLAGGERHPLTPGLRLEIGLTRIFVVQAMAAERTMMIDPLSAISDPGEAGAYSEEPTMAHGIVDVDDVAETTSSSRSTISERVDDFPDLDDVDRLGVGTAGESTSVTAASGLSSEADMAAEATMVSPPRGSEDSTVRRPSPSEVGLPTGGPGDSRPPLEQMMPRLVFGDEAVRGVMALDRFPYTIGRADADEYTELSCPLGDSSVSARHAEITLSQRRFFLEDAGSKNGTSIDGRSIPAMASREVTSDVAIQLGGVEGLFILDRDADLAIIDRSAFPSIVRRLGQEGKIKREHREEALRQHERGQHPGEFLVLSAGLAPRDWSDAVRAAASGRGGDSSGRSTALMVMLFLVVFVAVAYVVWRALS